MIGLNSVYSWSLHGPDGRDVRLFFERGQFDIASSGLCEAPWDTTTVEERRRRKQNMKKKKNNMGAKDPEHLFPAIRSCPERPSGA